MSQKVHDWIAAQIEASRPGASDPKAVTRLFNTAATLRGLTNGQCFGMQVALDSLVGSEALAERCLEVLREWIPLLSLDEHELGKMAAHVGLRVEGLPMAPSPTVMARLLVYVEADIVNIDAETEADEKIRDPEMLARYDGVRMSHRLDDVYCLVKATGGDEDSWFLGGEASLVYERTTGLRCQLTLDAARVPSDAEVATVLETIESELFYSAWGLNLDWEIEEADDMSSLSPSVSDKVLGHRLEHLV